MIEVPIDARKLGETGLKELLYSTLLYHVSSAGQEGSVRCQCHHASDASRNATCLRRRGRCFVDDYHAQQCTVEQTMP